MSTRLKITPASDGFVADISDVNLAAISNEDFEKLYSAWLTYGVLRLRAQTLDIDELQAFSARFGPLEEMPLGLMPEEKRRLIKNRFVTIISNIIEDGKPIGGLGSGESTWHSDMTYVETPPPASVLYAVEIPPEGGDTYFSDQHAAYQALPDALRDRIASLNIKHDAAHTSVGSLRPGYEPFDDPREAPGAVHSIVKRHEESGLPCLYLGRREWAYVEGLSLEDSEALLDELWTYASDEQFVWQQTWEVGDLIIWDNRRVLHRRDEIDPTHRRLLRRCQVLAR